MMRVSAFAMAPSLRRFLNGCRFLQAVQEIDRALRVRGGGEYRPLVVLQHLNPAGDIGGMVVANLRRQVEVGAQEGRAKLGDQLLHGVAFVTEALAPEFAREARGMPRPVHGLMTARGVVALG